MESSGSHFTFKLPAGDHPAAAAAAAAAQLDRVPSSISFATQ